MTPHTHTHMFKHLHRLFHTFSPCFHLITIFVREPRACESKENVTKQLSIYVHNNHLFFPIRNETIIMNYFLCGTPVWCLDGLKCDIFFLFHVGQQEEIIHLMCNKIIIWPLRCFSLSLAEGKSRAVAYNMNTNI